jgi:hypothetical protein
MQTEMMSVKSWHLLLLLYKICIPICAFLSALRDLKCASAVEVRSSSSQPASHGFLDCFASPVVVTSQVIFQGPKQVVVWGGGAKSKLSDGWESSSVPFCVPLYP